MIYFLSKQTKIPDSNTTPLIEECTLEDILEYFKDYKDYIGVDTETEGKDYHYKKILTLQLGDAENQFVIDCRHYNILLFKDILEKNKLILHNSKFDYKFFKAAGINIENIYDTMLAECVIYCGYPKWGYGLSALTTRYCNVTLDKTIRGEFFLTKSNPFTLNQILYAARDVTYLHEIKAKQEDFINKYSLNYVVALENSVVKALADIEYNGMYLDSKDWLEIAEENEGKLIHIEIELDDILLNDPNLKNKIVRNEQLDLFETNLRKTKINYGSPLQITKVLNLLNLTFEDTSDRSLSKLQKSHLFIPKLQEYREVKTAVERYGRLFLNNINKYTNRVHTDFWQVLNTGRISSGNDEMNAPNLQNIPASNRYRNCFKARPGFMWVSVDYSSQELRLMADGSNEDAFIDCINRGEDLHCYAGSIMFKRPITKADKDLRNKAKTINFGKPYGMGPFKLADTLSISIQEAEDLFRVYAESFPKLNKWLDSQANFALTNGYSLTFAPALRRGWYPEIKTYLELKSKQTLDKEEWKEMGKIKGQILRNGMNMPIQGSGADICKEALVEVRNLVKEYNNKYNEEVAYLICTVHDAVDVEVREDLAEIFCKEMSTLMIEVGNKYVKNVKMDVDPTITRNWTK